MRTVMTVLLICTFLEVASVHAADANIDSAECLVSPLHSHCAITPIEYDSPVYPTRAATRGITGWARLAFTITESGTVTDVKVIAAEPRGIFDTSSIRVVQHYRFEPRMVNGTAVPVHNVQHVFRYDM